MSSPPLPIRDADVAAFEKNADAILMSRLRQGLTAGIVVGVVLSLATIWRYTHLPLRVSLLPLAASGVMGAAWIATGRLRFQGAAFVVTATTANVVGVLTAITAVHTGGFRSGYYYLHILIYTFVTALLPVTPKQLVIAVFPTAVSAAVVVGVFCPDPGEPVLPLLMSGTALLFSFIGVRLRTKADLESFVAHARLDETRQSLATLNDELAQRVSEQVSEIVRRAGDIEVLNAQLREKVRERSRELALALRGVAAQRSAAQAIPEGTVLGGRVVVRALLGEGGMGAVYRGIDSVSGRDVAVKVLASDELEGQAALRRFFAEAEAASVIADEAIVKTLHVDVSDDGRPFLVMEYVDGQSLDRLVGHGARIEPAVAARIGRDLARALGAAHAAGVVHRDIKPSNVMIAKEAPFVRVLDFGVSKILRDDAEAAVDATAPGAMIGTPAYMAPEQVAGGTATGPASDVYSLGIVLYELLVGAHPFPAKDRLGLLMAHTTESPRRLDKLLPTLPEGLVELVHRLLAKKPEERPSAREVVELLGPFAEEARDSQLWQTLPQSLTRLEAEPAVSGPPSESSSAQRPGTATVVQPSTG